MPSEGIVLPPTPLYETLTARVINRYEESKYQRIRIRQEPIEWIKEINPDSSLIVGAKQLTDSINKVKYLYQWPFTFGELANEYLTYCLEDFPKFMPQGGSSGPKAPVAFRGPTKGTYAYVDIQACYFSLYRYITLDSEYCSNRFRMGNIPFKRSDELFLSKVLRNTVFGLLRKSSRTRYRNGKYTRTTEKSNYHRPMISDYVLSTMQAVAQEAWNLFDIKQWLTDAAIIPLSQAHDLVTYLNLEWNLNAKIESIGPSWSFGSGVYKVGNKVTKGLGSIPINSDKLQNFEPVDILFLKELRKDLVDRQSNGEVLYS